MTVSFGDKVEGLTPGRGRSGQKTVSTLCQSVPKQTWLVGGDEAGSGLSAPVSRTDAAEGLTLGLDPTGRV